MSRLDVLAAQAMFVARAFERAVHDSGEWSMEWGPFRVPASREVLEDSIRFKATFPAHCFLVRPSTALTLWSSDDAPVLVRDIEFPGDQGFSISWVISARESSLVS